MEHVIDNRLNRSLAIHDLDNLVFEKRQRKAVQPTLQFIQKSPIKKTSIKKKEPSPTSNSKRLAKNSPSKGKVKLQSVVQIKQSATKVNKSKKSKIKVESKSQMVVEQSISSFSSQSKDENEELQNNSKTKQILQKKQNTKIKHQSQRQNNDNNVSSRPRRTVNSKESNQQISKIKQQDIQDQNNQINALNQKRKRGRPKKIDKDPVNQLPQEKIIQQEPLINDQKKKIQLKVEKKQNRQIKIESNLPVENEAGKTRSRRAKMNPIIKYNQNDQDMYSVQSSETQKDPKKKKKICKNKPKSKQNKRYSLNRIFRKQVKQKFPAFQLDVNMAKLSFNDFVMQFGVFDMIHFSLPVKYLQLFPDMPKLMHKGFVFLWVQNKQTQVGYHLLNRWGYDVIDQIIWIKSVEQQGKIQSDQLDLWCKINDGEECSEAKDLFINMKNTCLVGYKCPSGNKAEYRTKVSNNIIFAKSQDGINKPQDIYQIADLMMPGAKKLEFGGKAQEGWLNLKHNQLTLYRCHNCLKEEFLYLLFQNSKMKVFCKKCIIQTIKQQEQENSLETLSAKFSQLRKSKIKQVLYAEDFFINCPRCKRNYHDIQLQGFVREQGSQQHMCIDCYQNKLHDNHKVAVQILIQKKSYYNQVKIQCSKCKTTSMIDLYFQCSKCKNHKICKNCFWSLSDQNVGLPEDGLKKANKQVHEWKMKLVKNNPLMRFKCYVCEKEMSLPFWSCQTCQSWRWCGKCQRKPNQIHPHYQNDRHNEYLMI